MTYEAARAWLTAAGALGTIVIVVGLALLDRPPQVLVTVGSICLGACMVLNFSQLKSFKIWQLEATMQTAIDEANATVTQLRELAVALAVPVLASMQQRGRFSGDDDRKENAQARNEVVQQLTKLGLTPEQLSRATLAFDNYTAIDLYFDFFKSAKDRMVSEKTAIKEVMACFNIEGEFFPFTKAQRLPDEIKRCLSKLGTIPSEVAEAFEDLNYFQQNRILRRPEVYLSH